MTKMGIRLEVGVFFKDVGEKDTQITAKPSGEFQHVGGRNRVTLRVL